MRLLRPGASYEQLRSEFRHRVRDQVRGEVPKTFVLLKPGHAGDPALAQEIQAFVKTRVAPYQYPRKVEFVTELPLTATGKIVRKDLRERERAKVDW